MGLSLFSSSSYEPRPPAPVVVEVPRCTYGKCTHKAAEANARKFGALAKVVKAKIEQAKLPNPNPKNYEVVRSVKIGRFLILKIRYPDCTNYEGNKILVYRGVSLENLFKQGSIDPHFCNNHEFKSPIARFVPTDEGWKMAEAFATAMNSS